MKKNGFTLLELLIGVSLISVVMIFLFRLLNDIQHEGLSNTYIVTNQTSRNEIISILDTAIYHNGSICGLHVGSSNTNKLHKIKFCNGYEIDIYLSRDKIYIEMDSQKYTFPMKDESAYYDVNMQYSIISYNGNKFVKFNIPTHKKGLRETLIDDIELMGKAGDFKYTREGVEEFEYTGATDIYTIPKTGRYKLEVWGAQGGGSIMNGSSSSTTSYGGYSVGYIDLNSGDTLYINVGGKGQDAVNGADSTGGYNGGGDGTWDRADNEAAGAGGGATHIATKSGLLSSLSGYNDEILIVAGGGGGKSWDTDGGNGGGYIGGAAGDGRKADQTTGYSFGKGENATGVGDSDGHGGGGGGYWGGYESSASGESNDFGGGGSGYIGNTKLFNKAMYCYDCTPSSELATKTYSVLCALDVPTAKCAKIGNGYAIITYLGN